jgi:hypothetical protein
MKTETTVQANSIHQLVKVSRANASHQSWESFPQPKSWAMAWDSRGLTHDVRATRGRASGPLTDQA